MHARRRLRDIQPSGWRLRLRTTVLVIALALAAFVVLSSTFASHEAYGIVHVTRTDSGYVPIFSSVLIILALLWMRRGRLLRTAILAPIVSIGALATNVYVAIQHLLTPVDSNSAEKAMLISLFLLFCLGWVIFIVEWIVVVQERKHLEKDEQVFPTARVVD